MTLEKLYKLVYNARTYKQSRYIKDTVQESFRKGEITLQEKRRLFKDIESLFNKEVG